MTIRSELNTYINNLRDNVITDILSKDIPLVGDGLSSAANAAVAFLDTLQTAINTALAADPTDPADIALAINNAGIAGVTAVANGNNVELTLVKTDTVNVALPTAALDFGGDAFGLNAEAAFAATITPELNAKLSFDTTTLALSLVDTAGSQEIKVGIGIGVDVSEAGPSTEPAVANLGPLDVKVGDNLATPEINLNFGLDFHSISPTDFTAAASGTIDLNLKLETSFDDDKLPTISTDIVAHWGYSSTGADTPTIKFDNVTIDLGSVVDTLLGTFAPIIEFLNDFPFGDIFDALTEPLPLIHDAYDAIHPVLDFLDVIPAANSPGGDGVVNMLDLVGLYYTAQNNTAAVDQLSLFAKAIAIIQQLGALQEAGGPIRLGSFDVTGGAPSAASFLEQAGILDTLESIFGSAVSDALAVVQGLFEGLDPNPLKDAIADQQGLTFPLFENPEKVMNILFPTPGSEPVVFVQYDLPKLGAEAQIGPFFFPVIGPFGITLSGGFGAGIDFAVGFDSNALTEKDFTAGVFISTAAVDNPDTPWVETVPHRQPREDDPATTDFNEAAPGFLPIGYSFAEIRAGVGVSLIIIEVAIEGGLLGDVNAFLPGDDGKLRLNEVLDDGCFFDPVEGSLRLDLSLRITIGFSIFSWTHRFTIAEVTLVEFSFGCDGAASDFGFSIASPSPDGVLGPDLLLNVGGRAGHRSIGGKVGTDVKESFKVTNAVDENGALILGTLTVAAFGILENYGSAANPMQGIFADAAHGNGFGNGDDYLLVADDVTQRVFAEGGIGDDRLQGGRGDDKLSGDSGFDILIGGIGNDELLGGSEDDLLEGGVGADRLDGGAGRDQVTYEHSTERVEFRYKNIGGVDGFVGEGGEAQGDFLISVEYIIGSDVKGQGDELYGNFNAANTLEGLGGNDVLIGGQFNDFILGGAGGDYMDGLAGRDGTSYLTSFGEVHIDLLFNGAWGGDATGDTLLNMEDVQGSEWDDVLFGNHSANSLDGWLGDDILEGRGGADVMSGGDGHDIVYAGADGDKFEGGFGIDLLSYVGIQHGVTVNLRTGFASNGDLIGFVDANDVFTRFIEYSTFENLDGSQFDDSLTGDLAYNTIRGLGGADFIDGEGGNDILVGGSGGDTLVGGVGIDLADYISSIGAVYVDLGGGFGLFGDAEGDSFPNVDIENLRGTSGADILVGNSINNEIDPHLSTFGFLNTPFSFSDAATGSFIDAVFGGGGIDTLVLNYSQQDYGQGLIGGYFEGSSSNGNFRRLSVPGDEVLDGVDFFDIEQLRVIGTYKADKVFGGTGNDVIATGGGDDLIYAGKGVDFILAQENDDRVVYGNDQGGFGDFRFLSLDSGWDDTPFYLDGGRGIDRLSISLAASFRDVVLIGHDPMQEFTGTNATLDNYAAITNFEILEDVWTGSGTDFVAQEGDVDNDIRTGWGEDIILPGLGNDNVDGGFDFQYGNEIDYVLIPTEEGFFPLNYVSDSEGFSENAGDLLILDYSSYDGPTGLIGFVDLVQSQFELHEEFDGAFSRIDLFTNEGGFSAGDSESDDFVDIDFREIERMIVTGSNQSDLLVGTYAQPAYTEVFGESSVRGDDLLNGLDGDDLLIGNSGSDTLLGGEGNDVLLGSERFTLTEVDYSDGSPSGFFYNSPSDGIDFTEIDTMTGGLGADVFVLGTDDGFFYGSLFNENLGSLGFNNHAIITDFNIAQGDVIQLNGEASNYFFVETTKSVGTSTIPITVLFHTAGSDGNAQLIAEIENFTGLDLNASYIRYVGGPNSGGAEDEAEDRIFDEANAPASPPAGFAAADAASPLAAPGDPWVTQTNDRDTLLNKLFEGGGGTGLVTHGPLELVGDGRAFGIFDGDPFGLGTGVVISTGQVDDLDSPNTNNGGYYPPLETPVTFTRIGTFNGSTIYRANLTFIAPEIRSLILTDSNSQEGGSSGKFSGFDIDAIALSRDFIDSVSNAPNFPDLNDPFYLGQLDVFDFSAAGLELRPGTQRAAIPSEPNVDGSINKLVLGATTLGEFDSTGLTTEIGHSLTLGDGGSLKFQLKEAVATDQPLYLYVAESGISDEETIAGNIAVSTGRIDSPNDLSTDFGLKGAENDTVSMTYKFSVAPGSNVDQVVFQFVMFSEELSEFAGSEFNDSFKLMLNGVNLAHLSDGAAANVNNLQTAPFGPVHPDLILNPVGAPTSVDTRADAYTKILTFAGAVNTTPGFENVLTIQVSDVRDGLMDSGILVKAGTLKGGSSGGAFSIAPGTISTGTPPKILEGGVPVAIPVTINPGPGGLTAPVTIEFDADPSLDFGNGPGVPFSHTFTPGGPLTFNLMVSAPDNHVPEGPRFDTIHMSIESPDTNFDGMPIAPLVVEIDDPLSSLAISDVTKLEGNGGSTEFLFTVTRTGGAAALSVDYATADDSAIAASGDYTAVSGTLNFAAGEMSKTIKVLVKADIQIEPDETFFVNLLNPVNASLSDSQGLGKILNDETADTRDFSGATSNTTVVMGATAGTVTNASGRQTIANLNNITTGSGNDTILGNALANILVGGAGNDVLQGNAGKDILEGGTGNDKMTGGADNDMFVFRLGFGHDTVLDLAVGDILDLRGLGFTALSDIIAQTDAGPNAKIHVGTDDIILNKVTKELLSTGVYDILV